MKILYKILLGKVGAFMTNIVDVYIYPLLYKQATLYMKTAVSRCAQASLDPIFVTCTSRIAQKREMIVFSHPGHKLWSGYGRGDIVSLACSEFNAWLFPGYTLLAPEPITAMKEPTRNHR